MKQKIHIAIGISAGIAAYKVADLINSLKSKNIKVSVIMTQNAIKMFGQSRFEESSGNKIYHDMVSSDFDFRQVLQNKKVEHIALADSLDLLIIAPSTANIIAKIANGIADDYLTTLILSVTCQVLIAPSMNTNMWNKEITQSNIDKLKKLGYFILNPDSGELACGYDGVGRLKNTSDIEKIIFEFISQSKELSGKKVIVTGGGTSIPIDSVRSITNRASGKMGKYIAEECFKRGADVLLLRAENSV